MNEVMTGSWEVFVALAQHPKCLCFNVHDVDTDEIDEHAGVVFNAAIYA